MQPTLNRLWSPPLHLRRDVHRWTEVLLNPQPRADQSHGKPYCIPAGEYEIEITNSPRFGPLMPHVMEVSDFEGILIHWGNYPKDTEGCCLVLGYVHTDATCFAGQLHRPTNTLPRKKKASARLA